MDHEPNDDRVLDHDLAELVRIKEQLPHASVEQRIKLLERQREIRTHWAGRYRDATDEQLLQMERRLVTEREELMDRHLNTGAVAGDTFAGGGLDALTTMKHNRMVDETHGRADIESELREVRAEMARRSSNP